MATRGVPNVYCYQTPSSTVEFRPNLFVDITDFIRQKLQAIDVYRSQTERMESLEPDNIRLTAQAVQGLEAAAAQTSAGLKVYLSDSGPIPSLKQIMERCGRGKGRLRLVLELERGRECEVAVSAQLNSTARCVCTAPFGCPVVPEV